MIYVFCITKSLEVKKKSSYYNDEEPHEHTSLALVVGIFSDLLQAASYQPRLPLKT